MSLFKEKGRLIVNVDCIISWARVSFRRKKKSELNNSIHLSLLLEFRYIKTSFCILLYYHVLQQMMCTVPSNSDTN